MINKKGGKIMKKVVVLTMVVALFIGIPFCVFAQEGPRSVSNLCKGWEAQFPETFEHYYKSQGHCVSCIQASWEPGDTPELAMCKKMRTMDPDEYEKDFGTNGMGPCIIFSRALLEGP
jgi:hypothetical protein